MKEGIQTIRPGDISVVKSGHEGTAGRELAVHTCWVILREQGWMRVSGWPHPSGLIFGSRYGRPVGR